MRRSTTDVKKNMKQLVWLFVILFALLIGYLFYAIYTFGDRWFVTPYNPRLSQARSKVTAGSLYDREGRVLARTEDGEREYADSKDMRIAVSHIVGDVYGLTRGAETTFAKQLYGFDDGVLSRLEQLTSGEVRRGNDVTLTIDAKLSQYIAEQFDGQRGAAVVMDYTTGEILASVSVPGFDPARYDDYKEDDGSTRLFNRATMGRYPPGSVFKIVTAASMIENSVSLDEIDCEGSTEIDGRTVSCAGGEAHGTVDLKSAFDKSCNVYFALSALKLGADEINRTAGRMGFNDDFLFGDVILYSSAYEESGDPVSLAQSGIGQYNDLATPMHMAMIAGAVANDGVLMEPKLLLRETTAAGSAGDTLTPARYRTALSQATARELRDMMVSAVEKGTGSRAALDDYTVGGKTGTAQYYDDDDELAEHAWFAGFVDDGEHTLCVAVMVEGGGSGGRVAAPIAGRALVRAIELGY